MAAFGFVAWGLVTRGEKGQGHARDGFGRCGQAHPVVCGRDEQGGGRRAGVRAREDVARAGEAVDFELSPSDPNYADVADQVTTVVPMHANAGGGFNIVGVDPSKIEIVSASIEADWLYHRLRRTVDAWLDVGPWAIRGICVLVVRVGGAGSPVGTRTVTSRSQRVRLTAANGGSATAPTCRRLSFGRRRWSACGALSVK